MKKYVMLYNIDFEESNDISIMNKILKAIPETKILNESRIPYNNTIVDGQSIWVPEEKYLIAWTIANYEELLDITFIDDLDGEVTSSDGVDWFNNYRNNDFFVKYF